MAEVSPIEYLNIASIKDHWLRVIAPNYFDFDNVNNYQTGIFGYINEVMGSAVEDGSNAVSTARREFYPVTAEYKSSLYKMATLQGIEIPLTKPATCKMALILKQSEVIANSRYENGLYTCVIDSCLKILVDNLQFMMDYPVVILTKKTSKGWSHTIHYDISTTNSLNTFDNSRYIPHKIIRDGGVQYLVLLLECVRQVECTRVQNIIIKDSILDTTSLEINFDGNLANFEVFYIANNQSPRVQMKKIHMNGIIPNGPFCYYEYISDQKIRLTFPGATSFVPEFNSEIETLIYTSKGKDGNFEKFQSDATCTSDSEDYPYNSTMTIIGRVNGGSKGGQNQALDEDFRTEIIRAYSTNNTYTTSNDLQIFFDRTSDSIDNMRVLFRKKRDDALVRLFGAYILMKDLNENIIPSATLDLDFKKSDIMEVGSVSNRVMIKPGTKFVYMEPSSTTNYKATILKDSDLSKYADESGETFVFTTPFLIAVNLQPNTVGYYLNSINEVKSIEYTYVNDDTAVQFIANNLKIFRNAMLGQNYYKISIVITPAGSDLDPATIVTENPYSAETDKETGVTTDINGIRAKQNGVVLSTEFVYEPLTKVLSEEGVEVDGPAICYLKTTIQYKDGSIEAIISSNNFCPDAALRTGYQMNFEPGQSFLKDDILATKLMTDLGKLKIVGDINGTLFPAGMYIPFLAEGKEGDGFVFSAYISTNDMIDTSANIEIADGIYDRDGSPNHSVALPMQSIDLYLHALYKNDDINLPNKYSSFEYLSGHTLTNSYISSENDKIALIEPMSFCRSLIDFYEIATEGVDERDYGINVTECPLLSYSWADITENYTDFINRLKKAHAQLQEAYTQLENNFSIDMKFYNTYGRSRFYTIGLDDANIPLNNIACIFRFGVRTTTLSNKEDFINKMRNYIKSYVENIKNATSAASQDIYILNMTAAIKAQFPEIEYLVYYGFNIYNHMAQKIVGPDLTQYQASYIPEFINIQIAYDADGLPYPNVEITLLEE